MYKRIFKRFFDFTFSLFTLMLLSPVFITIIGLLYFFNKRQVFFTQDRPGMNACVFKVIKFRTMTDERNEEGVLLPDENRLTKVGTFLRLTSLDEMPQLINILKADMSLIGPRPLLVKYLPLYSTRQSKRHSVRPGITGYAQINGRNNISWEKKFELDVWYVENISFFLDVKIFFMTIKKIFTREGVSKDGCATTETFTGSE